MKAPWASSCGRPKPWPGVVYYHYHVFYSKSWVFRKKTNLSTITWQKERNLFIISVRLKAQLLRWSCSESSTRSDHDLFSLLSPLNHLALEATWERHLSRYLLGVCSSIEKTLTGSCQEWAFPAENSPVEFKHNCSKMFLFASRPL